MTVIKMDTKTGKYFFVLDTGKDPMTGKRKQLKRRGFISKHEAKLALARLQVEVSETKELSVLKLPFQKYLSQCFEAKKIKLKPITIQNYEEQIRYNIVPYIGDVRMNEFSESIIQTYIQTLHKERKLSPADHPKRLWHHCRGALQGFSERHFKQVNARRYLVAKNAKKASGTDFCFKNTLE